MKHSVSIYTHPHGDGRSGEVSGASPSNSVAAFFCTTGADGDDHTFSQCLAVWHHLATPQPAEASSWTLTLGMCYIIYLYLTVRLCCSILYICYIFWMSCLSRERDPSSVAPPDIFSSSNTLKRHLLDVFLLNGALSESRDQFRGRAEGLSNGGI